MSGVAFLGKLGTKLQSCLFRLKFIIYTSFDLLDTVVACTVFFLDWKRYFGQTPSEILNCLFQLQLCTLINVNLINSSGMLTFTAFLHRF